MAYELLFTIVRLVSTKVPSLSWKECGSKCGKFVIARQSLTWIIRWEWHWFMNILITCLWKLLKNFNVFWNHKEYTEGIFKQITDIISGGGYTVQAFEVKVVLLMKTSPARLRYCLQMYCICFCRLFQCYPTVMSEAAHARYFSAGYSLKISKWKAIFFVGVLLCNVSHTVISAN